MHRPARLTVKAPIYILGQGRSGTTVLGVTLSLHRQIGFLNEPKALWHNAYPNEDLIGSYTDKPACYILTAADATPTVAMNLQRLYSGYLRLTRSTRILDKYPELLYRVPFVKHVFPDARFLLLVRNGMEVCRSVGNWSQAHGHSTTNHSVDWWGRDDRKWQCLINELVSQEPDLRDEREALRELRSQHDRAALEWVLTMRAVERVSQQYPEQALVVRYERLVERPVEILEEIFRFCYLEDDERVFQYATATLRKRSKDGSVDLHELVREPFETMMQKFEYA